MPSSALTDATRRIIRSVWVEVLIALIVEGYREFMEWWQTRAVLRPLPRSGGGGLSKTTDDPRASQCVRRADYPDTRSATRLVADRRPYHIVSPLPGG